MDYELMMNGNVKIGQKAPDFDAITTYGNKKMLDYIYSDEKKEELLNNIDSLTSGNTKNEMVKYFYKSMLLKYLRMPS